MKKSTLQTMVIMANNELFYSLHRLEQEIENKGVEITKETKERMSAVKKESLHMVDTRTINNLDTVEELEKKAERVDELHDELVRIKFETVY